MAAPITERYPRPALMGVVNVTPDSFSDGGAFLDPVRAVEHGRRLAAEGAALLDIGGESTRPGSEGVSLDEELRRVLPVVEALAGDGLAVSIDTSKAEVARRALDAGACMVNDVTALRGDPDMAGVVAGAGVDLCLMHMLGEPRTMQDDPRYGDVVSEVGAFLAERVRHAEECGIERERICVDPGIGFGKTIEHNLALLRGLPRLAAVGPLLVGVSRKGFLGLLTGRPASQRVPASVAAGLFAYRAGAWALRVHDVAETVDALAVERALEEESA